jgi:hypothetical protein
MCEIVIKHIAAVHPRNRQRGLKVQWVKDFCTKVSFNGCRGWVSNNNAQTIDKKLKI